MKTIFKINRTFLTILLISTVVVISSCTKNNKEDLLHDNCTYMYMPNNSSVTWTAYKYTNKVGVSGDFDQFNITTTNTECHNIEDVLQHAKIELTADALLGDQSKKASNLSTMFFGKLRSKKVSGEVLSVDAKNQLAEIELTFNKVTRKLNCRYDADQYQIELMTTINLQDFQAESCIDSLNTVCGELHKGADGIMMTWLDVDVKVVAGLQRVCN